MKLINYSGNQNKSGIYCIRNLINNKVILEVQNVLLNQEKIGI